jgi:GntR family transcriptional regulator
MIPAPIRLPDQRLPRYQRLRELLSARIASGEWAPGLAIPAETELAAEYSVALGTLRAAIGLLVDEGMLARAHGKGTFVRGELAQASMFRFFRFRGQLRQNQAAIPKSVIHELRGVVLAPKLAEMLRAGRSRRGIFMLRTRSFTEAPHLLEKIWLPLQPFKALLRLERGGFGDLLYPFYREHCGVVVARASEQIGFGTLTEKDAALLGLPAGHPVATIERTAYSLAGEPVEFRITQGDAHCFQYNVELK